MPPEKPHSVPLMTIGDAIERFFHWCREQPIQATLLAASLATAIYFYFFHRLWVLSSQSTVVWMQNAWMKAGGEQFHGHFPPFVSVFLIWYHRGKIVAAAKAGSALGLVWVGIGLLLFVVGARCVQPRMAVLAIPILLYGSTLFLWGPRVARIVLFPFAFLLFMMPVEALQNLTFPLQFAITGSIEMLSRLVGVSIQSIGTTLTARDGSFNFEIAEGCSGVRSLAAMSMLTAIYVHLTQDTLWKKAVIFGASLIFAIVGNVGRLFTVILFARFISPEIAGGIYHDWSGFLFFPIALLAMTGFARIVNLNWDKAGAIAMQREAPLIMDPDAAPGTTAAKPEAKSGISYDY